MDEPRQVITYLSRDLLHPSATNPRKHFPQESLADLGKSIEEHGVIQPLIVRESAHWTDMMRGETHYEIVAGERRYRSGTAVGLMEFPTIIRSIEDWEVIELQLIENLQREDVSAYEEAEGYAALLALEDAEGQKRYTMERIALKIGKSRQYVQRRIKVQLAPKVLLAALSGGRIGVRACEQVGRIPHIADRERCAAEILAPKHSPNPMTAMEVAAHISENYVNSLKVAVFDKDDAQLVSGAGGCESCPHRSGQDPDLADLLSSHIYKDGVALAIGGRTGIDPNLCLNPHCYRAKTEAHYQRLESEGEVTLIPPKDVLALFPHSDNLSWNSDYRLASERPDYNEAGHYDGKKLRTWGEYAAALGVKVVVAKSPHTGALLEVVPRSAVRTAEQILAKQEGRPSIFSGQRSVENVDARKMEAQNQKRDREIGNESVRLGLDAVSEAMLGNLTTGPALIALRSICDTDGVDVLINWMGLKAQSKPGQSVTRTDKVDAIIAEASDAERYDLEGVMILMVVASLAKTLAWYGLNDTRFGELAGLLNVDLKACRNAAAMTIKARSAEKAKKAAQSAGGHGNKADVGQLDSDVERVLEHHGRKGDAITRVSIQKAMEWSDGRTLAVYDEMVSRGVIAARAERVVDDGEVTEEIEIDPAINKVVEACRRKGGGVKVGWQEICAAVGWPLDLSGRERALLVFDEMIDRELIVKGVFNHGALPSADVASAGKSKLAAAAERLEQWD